MDSNILIGQNIRRCRTEKGMTARELAGAADITASMLSQIERGQANPSLNTLRLLSAALGEPMFRLFMDEDSVRSEVVRAGERRHIIDRGVDYELLSPDSNGAVELLLLRLTAHSATSPVPLTHGGEEIAFVTAGTPDILVGGERCTLHCGDSIRIRGGTPHTVENMTDEDAELTFAVSPPTF